MQPLEDSGRGPAAPEPNSQHNFTTITAMEHQEVTMKVRSALSRHHCANCLTSQTPKDARLVCAGH